MKKKIKKILIGELDDNIEYSEVLDLLGLTDKIDKKFDDYLNNLSDKKLIKLFKDYCYDYDEFLEFQEMINNV